MLWDAWLDLVHGARCLACGTPGRVLCRACARALPSSGTPVRPTPCPDGLVPTWAGGVYEDPLRTLLLAHKERRAFGLAGPLGGVLAGVTGSLLAAFGAASAADVEIVLVPVPSRPGVVRARGHDPMLRICRVAADRLRGEARVVAGVRVVQALRQRLRPDDQAGLGSAERAANLSGVLAARPSALAALARSGRPVLAVVCDDVLTTGATAREAQRALDAVGVPVLAVATVAATRRRLPLSRTGG